MINNILYLRDKILKRPNLINGFIEVKPTKTDYIHSDLGSVAKKRLKENLNWKPFRPAGELQKRSNAGETMACVTYSAMNCLETVINYFIFLVKNEEAEPYQQEIVKVFERFNLIKNGEANFSDRYIAKLSGTSVRGNNQKNIADAIRHYGLVSEDMWPYADGWSNFYSNIPDEIIKSGQELLKYIEFSYEWVNPVQFNEVKVFAPIQTSVYAWGNKVNGIYQRTELSKNHAVDNDYFEMDKYDGIFDSYNPFDKKVAWNFNLGYGMLYTIHLKENIFNKKKLKYYIDERKAKYLMCVEENGEVYELKYDKLVYLDNQSFLTDRAKKAFNTGEMLPISKSAFNELIN